MYELGLLLQRAADAADTPSARKHNLEQAFVHLAAAAAKGHPRASYECGWMCYEGEGVAQSAAAAVGHLEQAAAAQHPAALRLLATILSERGERARALDLLAACAAQDNAEALVEMAHLLLQPPAAADDRARAAQCLTRAAALGMADAHTELAQLLLQQAPASAAAQATALGHFRAAAAAGCSEGAFGVFRLLFPQRRSSPSAADTALAHLRSAARHGHGEANLLLGLFHRTGQHGLPKSPRRAARHMRRGRRILAAILQEGKEGAGEDQDQAEATAAVDGSTSGSTMQAATKPAFRIHLPSLGPTSRADKKK